MYMDQAQVQECVEAYQADKAQELTVGLCALGHHLRRVWDYHSEDLLAAVVRFVGTVFEEGESRRRWIWGLKEQDHRHAIQRQFRREQRRLR